MIGFYVFSLWPYNHPYSARTWTLQDWRGFAGGLREIGYDTILTPALIETMPNPLTPSDEAYLETLSAVIDMLHDELGMRLYLFLVANAAAVEENASRFEFQERPYYSCEDLINPGNERALRQLIERREDLLRPLARMDGIFIIDSDPGGYPGSTIRDFVDLLGEHRSLLNRLRSDIELIYWIHFGWRGACRWFEQGDVTSSLGTEEEFLETLTRLRALDPEPWGLAIIRVEGMKPEWERFAAASAAAEKLGLLDRLIRFNYGAVEQEPSFPITNFGGTVAYEAGRARAARGVFANAQTHVVQLPNILAFARGAHGLPLTESDYLALAEDILPGHGAIILDAWTSLAGREPSAMREATERLESIADDARPGELGGLIFNDPRRFVTDLTLMLRVRAARHELIAASQANADVREPLRNFVRAAEAWQQRHGYEYAWGNDAELMESLRRLGPPITVTLDVWEHAIHGEFEPVGDKAPALFERLRHQWCLTETFTAQLLTATNQWLQTQGAEADAPQRD